MTFSPPRCPNTACKCHESPEPRFYKKQGHYHPTCRKEPVQRFMCRHCGKSFSEQTFRVDYRDRRPDINVAVARMAVSSTGQRHIARALRVRLFTVQCKLGKLGTHSAALHHNFARNLPSERTYILDEHETFEGTPIHPLTVPIIIEQECWFIVATAVGSIRRLAKRGSKRRKQQDLDEQTNGKRKDESKARVAEALLDLAAKAPNGKLQLLSDGKRTYQSLARRTFGDRVEHATTSSREPRTACNPLFPINTMIKTAQDNCGRLRPKSWLATKKAACLVAHLHLFTAFRNFIRRRFNRDEENESPARFLGLMPRALRWIEALRWRQDWGQLSPHPLSLTGSRDVAQPTPALEQSA